ncbi:MAG: phospholipase D-like domain-containing protein [Verrucomicrobiota bacterium]
MSQAVEYATRTKGNSKVRVYEQRPSPDSTGGTGHVIAKYSDLIQKAIAYKQAHSGETVEIRFTTYRMSYDLYVGFNPAAPTTYLKVADTDFAGADSEKLLWSFCKAAQAGVIVKLIIHKAGESAISLATITGYLDDNGGANLSYKVVGWGDSSDNQMHNKFLLINKTRSGSTDYHSVVYTTSANVDDWSGYNPISSKNWQQTGVVVYQNSGLYAAYKKYFDDALWPHATDSSPTAFRGTMASLHAASGGLNYVEDADGISAYFYPVTAANFWSTTYNPVAKVFDIINNTSGVTAPFVKLNQGYLRFHNANWTEFGVNFMDEVNEMAFLHSIDLSNSATSNVRCAVGDDDRDSDDYDPIAANRLSLDQPTHSKNMTFALTLNGTAHYYSAGGSTNAKYNDFVLKANNILMVHEVGTANKEVYQDFYDVFDYIFDR